MNLSHGARLQCGILGEMGFCGPESHWRSFSVPVQDSSSVHRDVDPCVKYSFVDLLQLAVLAALVLNCRQQPQVRARFPMVGRDLYCVCHESITETSIYTSFNTVAVATTYGSDLVNGCCGQWDRLRMLGVCKARE